MSKIKYLSIAGSCLLALSLAACSGGGGRRIIGKQCPGGDFKLFPDQLPPNQHKIDLALADDEKKIPAGIYDYNGATLFYTDKSGLRLQVDDIRQRDGTYKAAISCTRDAKQPLSAPFNVDGVLKLDVSKDFKILGEVKNFTLQFLNRKFIGDAKVVDGKTVNSPREIYKDTANEYYMVTTDNNSTNYEIRSKGTNENGTYYLSVRLVRKDKPAATPAAAP